MWQVNSKRAFSMRFISYELIKIVLATAVGVCLRSCWQENEPPWLRASLTGLWQESEPLWLRVSLTLLNALLHALNGLGQESKPPWLRASLTPLNGSYSSWTRTLRRSGVS
jgi:hypothetical protein